MMKILLINPSQHKIYGSLPMPIYTPLGLLYIAAALEESGYRVKIIDIDAENIGMDEVKGIIQSEQPQLVGITVVTPAYKRAITITQMVKEVSKEIYTVLGGIHPTILWPEIIKVDTVDFIVRGEGELTVKELVKSLEDKEDLNTVDGLVWKQNGQIVANRERRLIDNLDLISFPAQHLLNRSNYSYPDTKSVKAVPIVTSRGCPYECNFCSARQIFGHRFRARSPENVVDEIEYLIRKYQAKEIHIWDDNFTLEKNRVFMIRDELKKRNIKMKFAFPNGIRVDCVDEELLGALKEMGTYSLAFGVESGSQKILDKAKKKISLSEIQEAFRLTRKYGIESWAFFVLGLPLENKDTIRETIDFAKRLNPDVVKFHIFKPYPGTEVFKELRKDGFIIDKDYENYGFHTAAVHMSPDLYKNKLTDWQKMAYREFYFRPAKLLAHLVRIKSWHRLSTNLNLGVRLFQEVFLQK